MTKSEKSCQKDRLTGSQEPSVRIAPDYLSSDGIDAEKLLRVGGIVLDPWQADILDDWMGRNAAGRWSAPTCGGSVPRQNGKTLLIQGRAEAGMLLFNEQVIYTAHLQKTATETFEEMRDFFEMPKLRKYVREIKTALGREQIILKSGARVKFLARTRNGGRGQHGDLLIIDEAQEMDENAQASFLPAISASLNPQTIYVGTPPDPQCPGTVFRGIREKAIDHKTEKTAWFEFSVPKIGDVRDRKRWASANPALGKRILLSTIEGECEQMDPDTFARERLGWWTPVVENKDALVIDPGVWKACTSEEPKPSGKTAYGVKFTPDGSTVCLCGAVIPKDGTARISLIECRSTAYGVQWLADLVECFQYHQSKNATKEKYYEGHIALKDVNLGIALPDGLSRLEIGCEWGGKCVDVLASRSMFDGYVGSNGNASDALMEIFDRNRLRPEYMKACRDELKFGCTFATLCADPDLGCRIRFHSPQTASARWDGEKGRIGCGMAIIDTAKDESDKLWKPSVINLYTDTDVWVLHRDSYSWTAERFPHRMGRPLMEPMVWNATSGKPFGRSRIKEPVRRLIEGYVRTMANMTIALEFDTTPQKYILGLTDDQYDTVVGQQFRQYVGNIMAATTNPETGENPAFGQLSQGSVEPHVQMMRTLATQFSAATGLSVTDTGVVNDANPSSSDAILAQTQTLVSLAEQLNAGNGEAMKNIALMAQAVARNAAPDSLTEEERDVIAHFKNPAMPSVSVTADAAIKIASARTEFASTDTFLEMIGFDQADIRRIKAQEQRIRGQQILTEEFGNDNNAGPVGGVRGEAVTGEQQGGADDEGVYQ